MRKSNFILLSLVLLLVCCTAALAQRPRRAAGAVYGLRKEKVVTPPDSATLAIRDSLHKLDSLHKVDSIALLGKSSLDYPAFSSARDSIVEVFEDGHRKIFYYGDVTVKYQDLQLTSEYMEFDMNTNEVFAKGVYDTLAREWKGQPVMTQGGKNYNMEEVRYNFDSHRARITNMITNEDEAIMHGRNIKMMEDNSINLTDGKYTVCDADDPHYFLKLTMAKVITDPGQKTVFGPAYLVVEDVKLPFIGLPFGFIPKRPERATGMLMPSFGEEQARGFYMRDAGMYFVFGDYFDLSVTGDYYTLGSWALDVNSRYKVNYKFNGTLGFNYSNDQTGERGTPEFYQTRNFGLKWSHAQDPKAHPGTTFSASVNFSSPSNSRYNSRSINEALQNQVSSSVSYGHNWNGKFNLSLNLMHSQNSRDSSYTFTLPNVTFSMSTIYPFKKKMRIGKEKAYEKISFGYNTALYNKINFKASEFNLKDPAFINKFDNSMTHNFSIGLPNFQLLKYLSFAPSVTYGMNWYFRNIKAEYDDEAGKVVQSKGNMFGSFGMMHRASAGMSMSTRLYGTFNFGKFHKIQAIRHVISPSASISYTPDMSGVWNGYNSFSYIDKSGKEQIYNYNRYTGSTGEGPKQAATASFSIQNNLEAKVRDFADTTGTGSKKVKLIDQLSLSGNYNFLAERFKMSTISMSISTRLFNQVTISSSAGFDPYGYDEKGVRTDKFAVSMGQGLLRLSNVSASASYSISGKGLINGNDGGKDPNSGSTAESAADYYKRIYYHPYTGEYIPGGWLYYTNPNVPWSVNLSANFTYRADTGFDEILERVKKVKTLNATLQASGNVKITPKMSMNATTGFDFIAMQMTATQMSFSYDLHCFNISVSWVPAGTYKFYSFRIAANASALADVLRFKKSSSYWDNGF